MTKSKIITWLKAHKCQLLAAGIGVSAGIGLFVYRKEAAAWLSSMMARLPDASANLPAAPGDTCEDLVSAPDAKRTYSPYSFPFLVSSHYRTLPAGQHPSAEKVAEATASGRILPQNQTFVDSYQKGAAA